MDVYRILEDKVVPLYYDRDEEGLPRGWIDLMRRSIASTIWRFSTTRMLQRYIEDMYLAAAGVPGVGGAAALPAEDAAVAGAAPG
jgi:starch phosphorylase